MSTAFDANAVRVAIEQNDAEINDDELSLISAISNLLPKNGDVPLDIAKPICPLCIHKLRMIGATFDVKKDAARDYAVASARDMFWTVHDIGQTYIDCYFHELMNAYHLADQRHRRAECTSDEAQEIGRQIFSSTMESAATVSVARCGSGKATNRGMLHRIANGDYEQLDAEVNWHPHYEREMGEDA